MKSNDLSQKKHFPSDYSKSDCCKTVDMRGKKIANTVITTTSTNTVINTNV